MTQNLSTWLSHGCSNGINELQRIRETKYVLPNSGKLNLGCSGRTANVEHEAAILCSMRMWRAAAPYNFGYKKMASLPRLLGLR